MVYVCACVCLCAYCALVYALFSLSCLDEFSIYFLVHKKAFLLKIILLCTFTLSQFSVTICGSVQVNLFEIAVYRVKLGVKTKERQDKTRQIIFLSLSRLHHSINR